METNVSQIQKNIDRILETDTMEKISDTIFYSKLGKTKKEVRKELNLIFVNYYDSRISLRKFLVWWLRGLNFAPIEKTYIPEAKDILDELQKTWRLDRDEKWNYFIMQPGDTIINTSYSWMQNLFSNLRTHWEYISNIIITPSDCYLHKTIPWDKTPYETDWIVKATEQELKIVLEWIQKLN